MSDRNEAHATGRITGGPIEFTHLAPHFGAETAFDIRFVWEPGATCASWWQDISEDAGLSPGSSAPVTGWASWQNGNDLLLAMASDELEFEAWAWR